MKTQKTKPQAPKAIAKNLEPRDERDVKAGSINFTKIEYKYTPFDDKDK